MLVCSALYDIPLQSALEFQTWTFSHAYEVAQGSYSGRFIFTDEFVEEAIETGSYELPSNAQKVTIAAQLPELSILRYELARQCAGESFFDFRQIVFRESASDA